MAEIFSGGREERTAAILSGVVRHFFELGLSPVSEFTLASGRRADIAALAPDGSITIVEIKSGRADFETDSKWGDYLEFADRFFFAVDRDFPLDLIAGDVGIIVADRYGAAILREAPVTSLAAARRKAMTLRLARHAADRLMRLTVLAVES